MKYEIKYQHLKPLEVDNIILRGRDAQPCVVCGEPTEFLDICYESRICSDECQHKMDSEINLRCNH